MFTARHQHHHQIGVQPSTRAARRSHPLLNLILIFHLLIFNQSNRSHSTFKPETSTVKPLLNQGQGEISVHPRNEKAKTAVREPLWSLGSAYP